MVICRGPDRVTAPSSPPLPKFFKKPRLLSFKENVQKRKGQRYREKQPKATYPGLCFGGRDTGPGMSSRDGTEAGIETWRCPTLSYPVKAGLSKHKGPPFCQNDSERVQGFAGRKKKRKKRRPTNSFASGLPPALVEVGVGQVGSALGLWRPSSNCCTPTTN